VIIFKIGGSILTDKSKYKKIRGNEINRIASELTIISEMNESKELPKLILIHGAGSFGHPLVKEKGLQEKSVTNFLDVLDVQLAVKELHSKFIRVLSDRGIEVQTFHPSSFVVTKAGEIVSFETKQIEESLKRNVVPVLHGDMVMDSELGSYVLSGDRIVSYLATKFGADKVGMGTNTPVLDEDGDPIEKVDASDVSYTNNSCDADVTGGMKNKIRELLNINHKCEAYIFDASEEGNIKKFMKGCPVGSKVKTKRRA